MKRWGFKKNEFTGFKKLIYPIFQRLWHWMYPEAARKAIEDWNKTTDLEMALKLIDANPESAQLIARFYIKKHGL